MEHSYGLSQDGKTTFIYLKGPNHYYDEDGTQTDIVTVVSGDFDAATAHKEAAKILRDVADRLDAAAAECPVGVRDYVSLDYYKRNQPDA